MSKDNNFKILKYLDEKKLKGYCELFDKHNLEELRVNEDGIEINLKSKKAEQVALNTSVAAIPANPTASVSQEVKANENEEVSEDNYIKITSPLAGTFYDSPSPDSPAFVKVGDKIKKGKVVCIVEAMKVMNEIPTQESGVVHKILVKSQEAITTGQVLMLLK